MFKWQKKWQNNFSKCVVSQSDAEDKCAKTEYWQDLYVSNMYLFGEAYRDTKLDTENDEISVQQKSSWAQMSHM